MGPVSLCSVDGPDWPAQVARPSAVLTHKWLELLVLIFSPSATARLATRYGIMAGSLLGRVDHYNPSKEEWTQYVERLEHFFTAKWR